MLCAGSADWSSYLILAVYIAMMIAISFISRKKSTSLNSFYMANRGLGGWMTAFAYGTTYFSAVIFVGYAGKLGMSMGLAAVFIGITNGIFGACLAWIVLAKKTRTMTRNLDTKTMPEFFEKRYESKYLKLFSSIIIFIFLIPYSTSVYQGIGYVVELVFGLKFEWCVLIMACLTALYLFVGGYFAEALSDFVQGIIMLIGVGLILLFMFKSPYVNGGEGISKLTEMGYGFWPSFNSASGKIIDSPAFNLIIMILLTSFGIWSLPQSIHKFHTVKDNNAIKKGTLISTTFALIIGGAAYLNGGLSRLFFPTGAQNVDEVVPKMFQMANFAPALLGLIAVLLLAASMSTLSAMSLSSSSTVAIDLFKGYIKKDATDQQTKLVLRVLCLVFVAISAILAVLKIDAIVTMMSLSWGTIAGCFIGPYIYGLYSKKTTAAAVYASFTFSLLLTLTLVLVFGFTLSTSGADFGTVIKTGIGRSPLIGVLAMISSMIITPIVSQFTQKPSDSTIKLAFSKEILSQKE